MPSAKQTNGFNRRGFLKRVTGAAAGAMAISSITVVSNSALLKLAKFKSSKVNR